MSKAQTQQLYQVECDAECGFLTRNHNEAEIVPILMTHCLNTHSKALTVEQARSSVRRL